MRFIKMTLDSNLLVAQTFFEKHRNVPKSENSLESIQIDSVIRCTIINMQISMMFHNTTITLWFIVVHMSGTVTGLTN
jgi:hypothetical protein